jgi:hypothetical protein
MWDSVAGLETYRAWFSSKPFELVQHKGVLVCSHKNKIVDNGLR